MKMKCPLCGKVIETTVEVSVGQHVVCPWCERKFSYGISQEKPVRIEVPDREKCDEVREGGGESVQDIRFGTVPELSELLKLKYSLFGLSLRKLHVVMCDKCHSIDIAYVDESGSQNIVQCGCGHNFSLDSGSRFYLGMITKVLTKLRRKRSLDGENGRIELAIKNFHEQEKVFEDDWNAYTDTKAEARIARIKELTDRLYKKLGIANSNKLFHAQHTTTRSMLGFCSNDGGSCVSLYNMFATLDSVNKQNEFSGKADALQKQIEQNECVLDCYYSLGEEFAGVGKEEARRKRLSDRVGYSSEADIPSATATEDVSFEISLMEKINSFVRGKAARFSRAFACAWSVLAFMVWLLTLIFVLIVQSEAITVLFMALTLFGIMILVAVFSMAWASGTEYNAESEIPEEG